MGDAGPAERLCRLDEIDDGAARGFELEDADGRERRLFVVRRGAAVVAYENRCPHRGTPLNWRPDEFFDAERRLLICATHGAMFRVEDGHCVAGPCAGDALTAVAVELRGGIVWVAAGTHG